MKKLRYLLYPILFSVLLLAFAACGKQKHTLRFFDGETELFSQEVAAGEDLLSLAPEVGDKSGLRFEGWSTRKDGEIDLPKTMPKSDATYYARYSATLTLSTNDGGAIATKEHTVLTGTPLAPVLDENRPVNLKEGLEFAGWYASDAPVAENAVMPRAPYKVTAKYYIPYSYELYRQAEDGSFPASPETGTGKGFYGEAFSYAPDEAHFRLDETRGVFSTDRLGADAKFTLYLLRETFTVYYVANLPYGADADAIPRAEGIYGTAVTLADGKAFRAPEIYRFAGWAETLDGAPVYAAGETLPTPEGEIYLYARWDEAYSDRFGGSDKIFLLAFDAGKAVLQREGIAEQYGTYDGLDFTIGKLVGKAAADRTFAYLREDMKKTYTKYDPADGQLKRASLALDGVYSAVYTYQSGETEQTVSGVYTRDEATRLFTFVSDALEFQFYLGSYTYLNETTDIFTMLGQEALLGAIPRYTLYDFGDYLAYDGYYATFDGMDTVTVTDLGVFTYAPTDREGEFTVVYDGKEILRMLVQEFRDGYGWLAYDGALAGEYTDESGVKLVLDGYGLEAKLGGANVGEWLYFGESDLNGKTIIETKSAAYLLDTEARTFTRTAQVYEEYYFLDAPSGVGSREKFLVLYADNTAEIYDGDSIVATGDFTSNAATGIFTLTTKTGTLPQTIVFRTASQFDEARYSYIRTYYLVETKRADGTVKTYYTAYTDAQGNRVRDFGNGMADYLGTGGQQFAATYFSIDEELSWFHITYMTFRYTDAGGNTRNLYYHVGENNALTPAVSAPTSYEFADARHATKLAELLWVDGVDGARYFPKGEMSVEGKYTIKSHATAVDDDVTVYTFTPKDTAKQGFDFMLVNIDGFNKILVYEDTRAGVFTNGTISYALDGFAFEALYSDADGRARLGQYRFLSDDVIRFVEVATGRAHNAKLDFAQRTCSPIDDYYGDFYLYSDGYIEDTVMRFDGAGHVIFGTAIRKNGDKTGEIDKLGEGSYRIVADDILELTLTYADKSKAQETFRILLVSIKDGPDTVTAYLRETDKAGAFVSEDLEVLILDGFGFATYVDREGFVYREAQYAYLDETSLKVVVDGYAHEVELGSGTFTTRDVYFNPVLEGTYGDARFLTTGEGTEYVRIWRVDEAGTQYAEVPNDSGWVKDASGQTLSSPLKDLPFTIAYNVSSGQEEAVLTVRYEEGGKTLVMRFSLASTLFNIYVVRSAVYYWTAPNDLTADGYTVRAYVYLAGSAGTGTAGDVMWFDLMKDGKSLPARDTGKDEDGTDYVVVTDGENAGYYTVTVTQSTASVTKYELKKTVSTETATDGTTLTATAYYALVDGKPCGIQLDYTQSNFTGGEVFALTTIATDKLGENVYYIYATYSYGQGAGVSEFHYVLTLGANPKLEECQLGYVYADRDSYTLYVLISYETQYAYAFDEFYVGTVLTEITNVERNDEENCWYLTTGTRKYKVTFKVSDGYIVPEVTLVTEESVQTATVECGGKTYTVKYALAVDTQTPYALRGLSADGAELTAARSYQKDGKFYYAVIGGDHIGLYEISFDGQAGGAVSMKKYDIRTVEYNYEYIIDDDNRTSTLFTCYYAVDEDGKLFDVVELTYRVGLTSAYTYSFDAYDSLKELGEGKWWAVYLVDTTYYHFYLDLNGTASLRLCYYSYTYDDTGYIFLVLYDMKDGTLYALGDVMATGNTHYNITNAESLYTSGLVWKIETENGTYTVTFAYDAANQVYAVKTIVKQ